jgi:WD40 repeat protein
MIRGLAFSPDDNGKVLLSGAQDQTGRLWDVATGRPLGTPMDTGEMVWRAVFAPQGKLLLQGSSGVSVWDRATRRLLYRCKQEGAALALHPDGRTFLVVSNKRAQFWDLATGKPSAPAVNVDGEPQALTIRPDGRVLLVLWEEGRFGVWDLETRRFLRTWPRPRRGFSGFCAALSPDGQVLLTGGDTEYAQFWDVATGRAKGPPLLHRAPVVGFSPDGRTAITCGGFSGEVRLWDVATAKPLGLPLWHPSAVFSFAFRADGRVLALGGNQLYLWPMPEPLAGSVESIRQRIEALTGLEIDADGAIRELDPDALRQRRQ